MKTLILDFESFFDSKSGYTLKNLSYPEYIGSKEFKVHNLGIEYEGKKKILWGDKAIREWLDKWRSYKGDYSFIAHNMFFDAAILAWHYNFVPARMLCTLLMTNHVLGSAKETGGKNSLDRVALKLGITEAKGRLEFMDGVRDPDPQQRAMLEVYLNTDLSLGRKVYDTLLPHITNPDTELWLIDHTLKMYATRPLTLDYATVDRAERLIEERRTAAFKRLIDVNKEVDPAVLRDTLSSNTKFEQALMDVLKQHDVPIPTKVRRVSGAEKARFEQLKKETSGVGIIGDKAQVKFENWLEKFQRTGGKAWLEKNNDITISETKEVPALAKKDEDFLRLASSPYAGVSALVNARLVERSAITSQARIAKMRRVAGGVGKMPVQLSYFGSHTGRWAGSGGFNFTNLSNPDRESDPGKRAIASAIRESFVAPDGMVFISADAAQIECVSEGSLVLTSRGLVPIEAVEINDKVWDGEEWVNHEGVVFKGVRRTVEYSGIRATEEHIVYSVDGTPYALAEAKKGRIKLARGEIQGRPRPAFSPTVRFNPCPVSSSETPNVSGLRRAGDNLLVFIPAGLRQLDNNQPAPSYLYWSRDRQDRQQWSVCPRKFAASNAVSECEEAKCEFCYAFRPGCNDIYRAGKNKAGAGCNQGEGPEGADGGENYQRVYDIVNAGPRFRFTVSGYVVSNCRVSAWVAGEWGLLDQFRNKEDVYSTFISGVLKEDIHKPVGGESEAVDSHLKLMRQAGKIAVLGLGYSMGWKKFTLQLRQDPAIAQQFEEGKLDTDFSKLVVQKYRDTYTAIVQSWKDLNNAFLFAKGGGIKSVGPVQFRRGRAIGSSLPVVESILPSGRAFYYRNVRQEAVKEGQRSDNPFRKDKEWKHGAGQRVYGGLLLENITQAISREILIESIIRSELEYKLPVILHVYDSVVVLSPEDKAEENAKLLGDSIKTNPDWAGPELALDSETKISKTLVT